MTPAVVLALADRAESESIRRFRQLHQLRGTVDDAARRADAHLRLEHALHHGSHASTDAHTTPSRQAA